jgi:hypothetical protein
MSNEATINFVYVSRLNDGQAEIRIETNSRTSLQDALVHLGLATASATGHGPVVHAQATAEVAQPAPEKAARKPKAKAVEEVKAAVAEAVAETVAETVVAVAETVAETVVAAVEQDVQDAPEVANNVAAPAATVEEAAAAVRAYGAKNGLQAARDLLQKFGFARTTEVTADKAGEIVAAAAL